MIPREQLKRCFRCKHNIQCWQLDEDIRLGASEKEQRWSMKAIVEAVKQNHIEHSAETAGDYMGMIIMNWIATLNSETKNFSLEYKRNAVYNPLHVVCAMANTSNSGWECPADYCFEEVTL